MKHSYKPDCPCARCTRERDLDRVRFGAVVVFKPGTTREEAERVLAALPYDPTYVFPQGPPKVQTFDPEIGGPVWYIP